MTFVESEIPSNILKLSLHLSFIQCNSLFLSLLRSQLDYLRLILNSADRAVSKTPRFDESPIFHLFLNPYICSKLINAFTTNFSLSPTTHSNRVSPPICTIFHVQSDTCTRSYTTVTLKRPAVPSRLKITDRSFTHHAPVLWNALLKE